MAKAVWNGIVIAESDTYETVEGNVYFPESSLKREFFRPSSTTSTCPWKGQARYYFHFLPMARRTRTPPGTIPIQSQRRARSRITLPFGGAWKWRNSPRIFVPEVRYFFLKNRTSSLHRSDCPLATILCVLRMSKTLQTIARLISCVCCTLSGTPLPAGYAVNMPESLFCGEPTMKLSSLNQRNGSLLSAVLTPALTIGALIFNSSTG